MKKLGVLAILFLLLFSITIAFADVGDDCTSDSDCATDETCEDDKCAEEETEDTSDTTTAQQDPDKIEDGFECLEEKAKDCKSLSTEEIALTVLATPDNIFDDCVDALKSKRKSNHWKTIKDTSLAILALKHAGEDTEPSEEWLLTQNRTPTELIWYLEQDSNAETKCSIGYEGETYNIVVGENKKIDSNAGPCLTKAQASFWLQIDPDCSDEEFQISCDQKFITTLLYKNKKSSTIYVLEGTESAAAFGTTKQSVNSKCFGANSCEYESTVWAAIALLETGHNIEEYIPYIIAMSDTNEGYLPDAFIYALTNYEDYASQLIADQELGNYWEAKQSANNRYYDTSLALIALGSSSSEQIIKARDWLLFSQSSSNSCWNNDVRDTAIVLWALAGRAGRLSGSAGTPGTGATRCSDAKYFCIPTVECIVGQDVGNNYHCSGLSETCCTNENLKTCSEYGGKQCAEDKICVGNSRKATDALDSDCCIGECQDRPTKTECAAEFFTCMDTCSEFQEEVSIYACDGAEVCCRTKDSGDGDGKGSSVWIWILLILILIIASAIGWIKRETLKLFWFKTQAKFKKDKGKRGPRPMARPGPRGLPRPGFPPVRRARPPVAPARKRSTDRRDAAMSETFKKLREMSR